MGVEVRPMGVACNLRCDYCYQAPMRHAGNTRPPYDLAAICRALEQAGRPFILFGGEPLLMPADDLETLFALGLRLYGGNAIQTNGTLVTEDHLRLFQDYKVAVGISLDGPAELNAPRRLGDARATMAATGKIQTLLERLAAMGHPPSLIVTLHQSNAQGPALDRLIQWFRHLDQVGIRHARLHALQANTPGIRADHALSTDAAVAAFRALHQLASQLSGLRFDVFEEMARLLRGDDRHAACVWRGCDPLTTAAVWGVEGDGRISNCSRINHDGTDHGKADVPGHERTIMLWHTPQSHGGCQGCRFFLMCRGQCPGTALNGDWRNRSDQCGLWTVLFTDVEADLLRQGTAPLSRHPRRAEMERALITALSQGWPPSLPDLLSRTHHAAA